MRLKDKIALITGAGSGIGRATAQCFAAEGATVIATDINQNEALITEESIGKAGGKCKALRVDVSQEQQVKDAIAKTVSIFGRLDIMHNNAGISIIKPTTEITVVLQREGIEVKSQDKPWITLKFRQLSQRENE